MPERPFELEGVSGQQVDRAPHKGTPQMTWRAGEHPLGELHVSGADDVDSS